MIRERRDADIPRLCAILQTMSCPSSALSEGELIGWLYELDAAQSWVFDMAPVNVAPTKNVVGHVQIYRPQQHSSPIASSIQPASSVLAIGRLFVKPDTFEYGIGRHLLREAVKYIQRLGKLPVLDLSESGALSKELCERVGFEDVPAGRPGAAPMVYTK